MPDVFSIAIDGPSGAGKSTVARAVAKRLGAMYLDTGAMYRAVGLFMRKNGVPLNDGAKIAEHCARVDIDVQHAPDGGQRVYLGGEDVSDEIRTAEASLAASAVSTVPAVRSRMVALQREIARGRSVVMDGRDIGTDELPDATLKVFLTASSEVRALRRHRENREKGMRDSYEKVLEEIRRRDETDTRRAASPLRKADGAVEGDSSDMALDEVVDHIVDLAARAMGDGA